MDTVCVDNDGCGAQGVQFQLHYDTDPFCGFGKSSRSDLDDFMAFSFFFVLAGFAIVALDQLF